MILLHRITPFVLGMVLAAGFGSISLYPSAALQVIALTLILVFLALARLNAWKYRACQFWNFVGTPLLFVGSAMGLFLFFENSPEKIALAIVTALGIFLYSEHLFTYLHIPTVYRTYSLEYLSLVMNVMIVFFLGAVCYGLILFLQTPLALLSFGFFILGFFIVYGMLWVSKIDQTRVISYALGGAVILTEMFVALAYMPTSFYTNAVILAMVAYVFLGICRAHLLDKLSRPIVIRYAALGGAVLIAVLGSSVKWI